MVLRWVASALLETEKSFRRIMGCEQLWMLKSYLDNPAETQGSCSRTQGRITCETTGRHQTFRRTKRLTLRAPAGASRAGDGMSNH